MNDTCITHTSVDAGACSIPWCTEHKPGGDAEMRALASLDLDKNKCRQWRPGDDFPAWWGQAGSVCGGAVACKVEDGVKVYVPVLCKRWSCDVCSYYRYSWLVRNLVHAVKDGGLDRFWTLTLNTEGRSPDDSFRDIQHYWKLLCKRIRKTRPKFEYVWVVQTTERGYAHLHIIVNCYIHQDWLRAAWLEITGDSWMVFLRKITSAEVAPYIARYIGKEARERRVRGSSLKGMHLFGTSAGVEFSEFMPGGQGWEVVAASWASNAAWLRANCHVVEDRLDPSPRIAVRSVGETETLRAWSSVSREGGSERGRLGSARSGSG